MTNYRTAFLGSLLAVFFLFAPTLIVAAQDKEKPVTLGVNHIGLAVKDLEASAAFFIDTLGWRKAGGVEDYPAIFVTDGNMFLTLWRVTDPATSNDFNRKNNVGLHHLAITVESLDALNMLHEKFKSVDGLRIEFAPEFLGNGPTTHMMIREPSGNRLEFIVPASRIKQ
ncbi:VOC family protein [Kordiimonas aquimaris]|uniref:VOC family protein n=1 Tax=Kordiimonas aquimaris TaxID=707591 RepID=UPI0021D0E8B4|nr:VOC family protein [Kordiimonas aquimaris]